MSDQRDAPQSAYLNRVSQDLSRSLRRCQVLIDDYRAHLAPANSNEAPFLLGDGEQTDGEPSET